MEYAQKPKNEIKRLEALVHYEILDTPAEQEYDDLASLAAYICRTPVAMVSFLDETRKWYKAKVGTVSTEMKRDIAVCSHTIVHDTEIMIIEDATKDPRFIGSPATQGATPTIFYAGVKLVDADGYVLGTLCVVDHKPGSIDEHQANALVALAHQVIRLLEHRRNSILLRQIKEEQTNLYQELEQFSYAVAHDIKSPLSNMIALSELIQNDLGKDSPALQQARHMKEIAEKTEEFVDGLLNYFKADELLDESLESIDIRSWLKALISIMNIDGSCKIILPENDVSIMARKVVLDHIFINLFTNAIKHNDKKEVVIRVKCEAQDDTYLLSVSDNGMGIAAEDQEKVFHILTQLKRNDTNGTGMGLAIVKKLVEKEGGSIELESQKGKGTTFHIALPQPEG